MKLAIGMAALAACGGASALPDSAHPTRDTIARAPLLELDRAVHGSTADPDPYAGAICTGGGTAGVASARAYRFVPPTTGDYELAVHGDFAAIVDLGITTPGPQDNRDLGCAVGVVGATLRAGQTYSVTVDGVVQARGTYDLVVRRAAHGRVQPEDAAIARAQLAAAPVLAAGRTLGTYSSVVGGTHASCGGLGGDAVYTLEVAAPTTLALHAITQFPSALDLRDAATGASVACARSEAPSFELALTHTLAAGRYVVVLDATDVTGALFDPLSGFPIHVATPGAGVRGAFAIDNERAPGVAP